MRIKSKKTTGLNHKGLVSTHFFESYRSENLEVNEIIINFAEIIYII